MPPKREIQVRFLSAGPYLPLSAMTLSHPASPPLKRAVLMALALAMGAAISLGITRFSYGLLLPPMRADLQWSYALAGAMNTANALGYLVGALATPKLLARMDPLRLLILSAWASVFLMALTGFFVEAPVLLLQRMLAGVASAFIFVAGGLLVSRLAHTQPQKGGLLLGIYYSGTGLGIVLSAFLVPLALHATGAIAHSWAYAWWALALACLALTLVVLAAAKGLEPLKRGVATPTAGGAAVRVFKWHSFRYALAGYAMFGVGYIGYMTFIIALLRERGQSAESVTLFYALLGVAVMASSRVWSRMLDRYKGGQSLAILNGLLGVATVLPVVSHQWPVVLASGLMFGGIFLSLVASTTALVRHNLPAPAWAAGISAFTVVFAAGQIIGPTVVGLIADGSGGLAVGLAVSACALWVGALLAWQQKPLA
jgi:predicted MFS family arabinose efflux permease